MNIDLKSSKGLMEWVMSAGVRQPDSISSPEAIDKNMVFLEWDRKKSGILIVALEAEGSLGELDAAVSQKWISPSDPLNDVKTFELSTEEGRAECLALLKERFPA